MFLDLTEEQKLIQELNLLVVGKNYSYRLILNALKD